MPWKRILILVLLTLLTWGSLAGGYAAVFAYAVARPATRAHVEEMDKEEVRKGKLQLDVGAIFDRMAARAQTVPWFAILPVLHFIAFLLPGWIGGRFGMRRASWLLLPLSLPLTVAFAQPQFFGGQGGRMLVLLLCLGAASGALALTRRAGRPGRARKPVNV